MAWRCDVAERLARDGQVDLEVLPDLPGGEGLREHVHRGGSRLSRCPRLRVRRVRRDLA